MEGKTRLIKPEWYETMKFLAGMVNRKDLVELIMIISKDYFKYYPNGHPDFEDYLFNPNINEVLLAGECFLEGRLEKEYFNLDKCLREVYEAYESATAYQDFMSRFTGDKKNNQRDTK